MDIEAYFFSLAQEFEGLRNRIRNFIGTAHWPTDGEWKESVLRAVMSRSIPPTTLIGRGFFVGKSESSPQIDVLLYRADAPVFFRDGNLVIIPGAAVVGLIEVKTRLDRTSLRDALIRLAQIRRTLPFPYSYKVLLGLFSYESDINDNGVVLEELRACCSEPDQVVDVVCLGPSRFFRYWQTRPGSSHEAYEKWHSYTVTDMAFGYFIHNFLTHVSPREIVQAGRLWFPEGGKELFKDGEIFRNGALVDSLGNRKSQQQNKLDDKTHGR